METKQFLPSISLLWSTRYKSSILGLGKGPDNQPQPPPYPDLSLL